MNLKVYRGEVTLLAKLKTWVDPSNASRQTLSDCGPKVTSVVAPGGVGPRSELHEIEIQHNIPLVEYEHMLENFKGDGAASVSVEASFSDMNYGSGISLKVRITLTCNQSYQDVETAYSFAQQIAQDQLDSNIPEVRKLYNAHLAEKQGSP